MACDSALGLALFWAQVWSNLTKSDTINRGGIILWPVGIFLYNFCLCVCVCLCLYLCLRLCMRASLMLSIPLYAGAILLFGVARKAQLGPPNFPHPPPLIRAPGWGWPVITKHLFLQMDSHLDNKNIIFAKGNTHGGLWTHPTVYSIRKRKAGIEPSKMASNISHNEITAGKRKRYQNTA